jgi:hypothetical protein
MVAQAIEKRLVVIVRPNPKPHDYAPFIHSTDCPISFAHLHAPDNVKRVPEVKLQSAGIQLQKTVPTLRLLLNMRWKLLERLPEVRVASMD